MSDKSKFGTVESDADGSMTFVIEAKLSPDMEARTIMAELQHGLYHAVHFGNAKHFTEMNRRWHEFCVRNPDIAEKYGYDPATGTWVVKMDPRLQKLIDEGKAPPYRPMDPKQLH